MPEAGGSEAGARPSLWARLPDIGVIALACALPLAVMTYRGLPLVVGVAALCLLLGWGHLRALRRPRDTLMLGALVLLVMVATLSLERTPAPRAAAEVLFGHVAPPLLLGLLLASAAPPPIERKAGLALAGGVGLAALLLIVEIRTGLVLHRLVGANLNPSKMNQSAVVMTLWLWPALLLAARVAGRAAALGLFVVTAVAVFMSESETAKLALLVGSLVFGVFHLRWRWLLPALAVVTALFILVQPVVPALVDAVVPPSWLDAARAGHAAERLVIWRSFAAATAMEPMAGFGFDSSGDIGFGPLLDRFPPDLRTGIRDSHPHNMALQVWVELGLMGAFLLTVALGRMVRGAARLPTAAVPAAGAAISVAIVTASVGYGAWQAWWLCALAMLPVWLTLAGADGETSAGRLGGGSG